MSASELTITARIRATDCIPDGSKCRACGEAIYLNAKMVWVKMDIPRSEWDRMFMICGSCAEEMN